MIERDAEFWKHWHSFAKKYGSRGRDAWAAYQQELHNAKTKAEQKAHEADVAAGFDALWNHYNGDGRVNTLLQKAGVFRTAGGEATAGGGEGGPEAGAEMRSPVGQIAEGLAFKAAQFGANELQGALKGDVAGAKVAAYGDVVGALKTHYPNAGAWVEQHISPIATQALHVMGTQEARLENFITKAAKRVFGGKHVIATLAAELVPDRTIPAVSAVNTRLGGVLGAGLIHTVGFVQHRMERNVQILGAGIDSAMNYIKGLAPRPQQPVPQGA